jgi:hypothetical protein
VGGGLVYSGTEFERRSVWRSAGALEGNPVVPRTQVLRSFRDLKVYQLAFKLAMDIFKLSRSFPDEERYSFTSQIRRSSRSVAANIAEGFHKRRYPNMFASKPADSDAEAA